MNRSQESKSCMIRLWTGGREDEWRRKREYDRICLVTAMTKRRKAWIL